MNDYRVRSDEEIEALIPACTVRYAFMHREDIAPLPPEEQEARWAEHQVKLQAFLEFLARTPSLVIGDDPVNPPVLADRD